MARRLGVAAAHRRPGARAPAAGQAGGAGARSGGRLAARARHALRQHRSRSTQQPAFPGDLAIEERLASLMRWNALAMVVRANQAYGELGGHIASYASAADLFEVGFNHFFRARNEQHGGDLVFFQPHSAPGVYARAFLEGRLSESDLAHYRQEITAPARRRARPVQLSASLADAGLLAVPHRLDGHRPDQLDLPRALHALPHAPRAARLRRAARCGACSATARWTSPRA